MKTEIAANMIKGIESVGGKLYFGENEMTFKSHVVNIQKGTTVIPYSDIQTIKARNTLWIVPNGISVTLKNGQEIKFVIGGREEVIQFIKSKANIT